MATYLKVVLGGLESGVGDLAVVQDDGVTLGAALLVGPANALGELGVGVGQEQLGDVSESEPGIRATGYLRCRRS